MMTLSDSAKIGVFVHSLDIMIKVSRYFPIISLSLASLNLFLAVNDFLSNNIGFAILNSLFAVGGLIFLLQMRKMTKAIKYNHSNYNKMKNVSTIDVRK